jgi:hypothetical protein
MDWYAKLYRSLLISSFITFIVYSIYTGANSLRALIAGFVLLLFAVLMILYSLAYIVLNETRNGSTFQILSALQANTGPFILTACVIIFVIKSLIEYFDKIATGRVSPGFNTFSNILIILSFMQIYIIFNSIQLDKKISNILSGAIYLIGILSGICSLIIYTILTYYTTDG